MYIYIYICMYMYTHTHTHTHTSYPALHFCFVLLLQEDKAKRSSGDSGAAGDAKRPKVCM